MSDDQARATHDQTDDVSALRADVAALAADGKDLVARVEQLSARLDALATVEQLQDHLADVASGEVVGALWDEVRGVRDAIDGLGADGSATGEVLAALRSEPGAAEPTAPSGLDLDVLADQVASLRDLVATEVDGLRQAVVAAADRTEALVRSEQETRAVVPADGAGLDPAVLAELKDEIRAAGAIGDQVVDALREELKALRRRIAVKASEKVLDEDQLRQIADAVAARLEKG